MQTLNVGVGGNGPEPEGGGMGLQLGEEGMGEQGQT